MPSDVLCALTRCERCHRQTAEVIESRRTRASTATRRRKQCRVCKYRFTDYELSAGEYTRLISAAAALAAVRRALGTPEGASPPPPPPAPIPCDTCQFNESGCTFDYPEYNTPGAVDCFMITEPFDPLTT